MTVRDLIKLLQNLPDALQDLPVAGGRGNESKYEIRTVETDNQTIYKPATMVVLGERQ